MTSYEELTPDQREQVDAFMTNIILDAQVYRLDNIAVDYIREHASNLVLTCVYIEKQKRSPINKRVGRKRGVRT